MTPKAPSPIPPDLWFEAHRAELEVRWFELLRFPSIASESDHAADCDRCADWLRKELEDMGFAAGVLQTPGRALVLAERPADRPGLPSLLFYGHYDVQPVDPLSLWNQPDPFEPVTRDERVYARGAQDDKGQIFFALQALRPLREAGVPLPRIQVLLEGEEECGSHGLRAFLREEPCAVSADVLLACDTGMAPDGRPAVVAGLRGIVELDVTMDGADHDLHSGQHGGVAPNAALGLARLLASLHHPDGRIAVEGFLDGLSEPTAEERDEALAQPFDADAYRTATGAEPVGGEAHLPPAIRLGFRPTIEVNGLHGGYGGPGTKTIVPARAQAKLSARLCPRQDPAACLDAIERHLRRHTPPGLRLRVERRGGCAPGLRLPLHSATIRRARAILDRTHPRGCALLWEGASIPVIGELATLTGAEPLLVGFGLEEDRIHAPNESYSWTQARQCFRFYSELFARSGSPV